MPIWLIIVLAAYFIGLVWFIIAMFLEAPKHSAQVGGVHFVIAFLWPAWGIWFVWLGVSEWIAKKRAK
jgi:hypothetical protein